MKTTSTKRNKLIKEFKKMGATSEQINEWFKDPIKLRIINALSYSL